MARGLAKKVYIANKKLSKKTDEVVKEITLELEKNEKIDKIYTVSNKEPSDFRYKTKALNILINARNEAHRFAITFHRDRRKKSMLGIDLKENLK